MKGLFRGALLVLCLAVLGWNGAEAEETNADNHACTYFRDLDFDCNNKLTTFDFLAMFTYVLGSGKLNLLVKAGQALALAEEAANYFPLVGQSTLQNFLEGGMTREEFRTSMKTRRNNEPDVLEADIRKMVAFIHKVFSTDSSPDKSLSYDDFLAVYQAFRIPESGARDAFKDQDVNGDGKISKDECTNAAILFFIGAPLNDKSNSWGGVSYDCDYDSTKAKCDLLPVVTGLLNIVVGL